MYGRRRGGNSSDSDSALAGGSTPYRRRSPQHPFWLTFLDPALEAAFVAWQAQQQFAVGVRRSNCHACADLPVKPPQDHVLQASPKGTESMISRITTQKT